MSNIDSEKRYELRRGCMPAFPPRIIELIESGAITAQAFFSSGGVEVWYRKSDPKLSHLSYDEANILGEFPQSMQVSTEKKVTFALNSTGFAPFEEDSSEGSSVDANSRVDDHKGNLAFAQRLAECVPSNYPAAAKLVADRKLSFYRKQGLLNKLPDASLHARDFSRGFDSFVARAFVVAHKRTQSKIWGAIGNQINSHGAKDIREWWSLATPGERISVLSTNKDLDISKLGKREFEMARLLGCPF